MFLPERAAMAKISTKPNTKAAMVAKNYIL